ncbi:hypothetical protein MUP77_17675 [Candidatus Bathyarchaeota archaeon]|nr:hypothetical protein [Candidatus Bathyarchaeota archaeon]
MAQYVFSHWEDDSTNPVRTLTMTSDISITSYYTTVSRILSYNSSPVSVPCTVNGQTVNPGQSIQIADGTQVTISVPVEVTI